MYFNYVTLLLTGRPVNGYAYIEDASPNNIAFNNGTIVNSAKVTPFLPNGYYSYSIGGSGNYIVFTGNALPTTQSTFTLEAWCYMTATPGGSANSGMMGDMTPAAGTCNWSFGPNNSNVLELYIVGGTSYTITGNTVMVVGTWYHLAASVSSNTVSLYVNGVQQTLTGGSTIANRTSTTNTVAFGQWNSGGFTYTGYVSNARITSGTALYTTSFVPSTTPLTAITGTTLLTCQSNRLVDNSINNYPATPTGTVKSIPSTPFSATNLTGYYSSYFQGTAGYLSLASSNTAFQFTGNFTIEAWAYCTVNNAYQGIISTSDSNATSGVRITINTTGFLEFGLTGATGYTSTAVPLNQWFHVAIARSGSTAYYFLNGALLLSTASSGTIAQNGLVIGRYYATGTNQYWLTGNISNVRVVNGTAVYTAAFTPSTTPLTAITNTTLLTCQNSTFIDNSTSAATITNNGTVTTALPNPFTSPTNAPTSIGLPAVTTVNINNSGYYSGYFDGSTGYFTTPAGSYADFGSSAFTVECWIYTTLTSTQQVIAFHGYSGSGAFNYGWNLQINTSNQICFYANGTLVVFTDLVISTNAWTHIAVVGSGGVLSAYKNGTKSTVTNTYTSIVARPTATTVLGGWNNTNENIAERYWYAGYVSNFRIVNGTAVYTSTFTVPTSPLTAITNTALLTCQNSIYVDNSTNSLAITAVNKTQPSTYQPFTAVTTANTITPTNYGSAYFDGSQGYLNGSTTATNFSGNFTVECWIYPTAYQTSTNVVGAIYTNAYPTDNQGIYIGLHYTGYMFVLVGNGAWLFSLTGTVTVPLNQWTHLALVKNGSVYTGYTNGLACLTATNATAITYSNNAVLIGARQTSSQYYQGYISNVRATGTALYNSNFIPSPIPLTVITNTQLLTLQNKQSNNNSTFYDDSTNSYPVTRVGTPTQGTFTPFAPNYSVYFDQGTGGFLSTPNNPTQLQLGSNNFTVECWLNISTLPTGNLAVVFSVEGPGLDGVMIGVNGVNTPILHPVMYLSTTGGSYTNPANPGLFSTALSLNTWYHIAYVRNGNVFSCFINGVQDATTFTLPGALSYNSSCNATVGARADNGANYFAGYLSNVRVLNGTALYTSNFTPPTTPLTAITNTALLTCQSNRFVDNSVNNFTLTQPNGGVQVQSYSPFNPEYAYNPATNGGSMYFNGTTDYLTIPYQPQFNIGAYSQWTVEAWVYLTVANATVDIIAQSDVRWRMTVISGVFTWGFNNGSNNTQTGSPSVTLTPYQWYHLAVTCDGSNPTTQVKMYVNGVYVPSSAGGNTPSSDTSSPLYVGVNYNGGSTVWFMQGYICNPRILGGTALYTGTGKFTPPTAPYVPTINTGVLFLGTNTGLIDFASQGEFVTVGNSTATYTQPNTVKLSNGSNSGAVYFNGSTGYLIVPHSPSLNLSGSAAFTIEAWVYWTGSNTSGNIVNKDGVASSTYPSYGLQLNGTASVGFTIGSGNGTSSIQTITSSTALPTSQWVHIAATLNSGTLYLYQNGTQVATATKTATMTDGGKPLLVGYQTSQSTPSNLWSGYMQELRITKGVARYTANFTPPAAVFPVI